MARTRTEERKACDRKKSREQRANRPETCAWKPEYAANRKRKRHANPASPEVLAKGRAYAAAAYAKPEVRRLQRNYRLKCMYGITVDEYDRMLAAQGNVCAICMNPPPGRYGLFVDHCHETGLVRGLLCTHCNTALGHAKDNVLTLYAMAAYLQGHRSAAGAESIAE